MFMGNSGHPSIHQSKMETIVSKVAIIKVDIGEVKATHTKYKEKCFEMTSSAFLLCCKAPQIVLINND